MASAFFVVRNRIALLASAVTALLNASLNASLNAQIVQSLPPVSGANSSFAQSINSAGVVAGFSIDDNGNSIPTLWQPGVGGGYFAQKLPMIAGNTTGAANFINANGNVVGYAQPDDLSTAAAVVWSLNGGSYTAAALTSGPSAPLTSAFALNGRGDVAGFTTDAAGASTAVAWQASAGGYGNPILLPAIPNQTESGGNAIDSNGDIVGYASTRARNASPLQGVVWLKNGDAYTANPVIAADTAQITALNDDGTGAGVYAGNKPLVMSLFDGDFYATNLDMPFDSTDGASDAVNNSDTIVGYVKDSTTTTPGREAAIWLPTDFFWNYLNLDQWLDETDPALGAHWTLSEATGISDNNLVTGTGIYDDGAGHTFDRSFVLDVSSILPEPSSAAICLITLPLLLLRRNYRARAGGRAGPKE